MAGKFNYERLHKYPHLLGDDKRIWDRFVILHPTRFDTVDYDIHVGSGEKSLPETDKKFTDQWRNLTKKRIDVIGWKMDQPTIVEVKGRVGLDTLGQVLGYRFLFKKDHPDISGISLLVVCGSCGLDDQEVLTHYGINFEIVG